MGKDCGRYSVPSHPQAGKNAPPTAADSIYDSSLLLSSSVLSPCLKCAGGKAHRLLLYYVLTKYGTFFLFSQTLYCKISLLEVTYE
jgi:hypothetical protein